MAQTPFQFQNVQIDKGNRIGIGKKILVYPAECDGLPCAAQMLDLTTAAMPENVHNVPPGIQEQFDILSRCQHPNIVQYLGTTTDSETGVPAFLVERMDSNLHEFLVQARAQLPYHVQVDICHDIGKALNYLHLNGIIHCNLSNRNILLSGGKAKVDISTSYILRKDPECPGTPNYMPPEAFEMQCTSKLDCFSFGVLAIEIITRESPDPGPRNQSEVERRKTHTDQINTLTDEAVYRRHEISSVMSDFRQCPWEIGSAPAERAGQGEVGGCTRRVQTAWRCLGLALKSPWLEPSGPLLSSFAQMG